MFLNTWDTCPTFGHFTFHLGGLCVSSAVSRTQNDRLLDGIEIDFRGFANQQKRCQTECGGKRQLVADTIQSEASSGIVALTRWTRSDETSGFV